jgi:hypothetical protein
VNLNGWEALTHEEWHLCEAVCLTPSPPRSFDIFDGFNFFDLDISSSGVTPLTIQRLTARRFGVRLALARVGRRNVKDLAR